MRRSISALAVLACSAAVSLATGCRKPATPPPAEPRSYTFTATNVVVREGEIRRSPRANPIYADFNRDGLKDVAVLEENTNALTDVVIYIRRPSSTEVTYYRGGAISRKLDGKIIGIGSSRRDEHTDLVLVVTRTTGTNEFVHFYNTGGEFSDELAEATPATP